MHEEFTLPDGIASSVPVHRFVCNPSISSAINTEISHEASWQSGWLSKFFGVEISNVGGYHSAEEIFARDGEGQRGRSGFLISGSEAPWYGKLLKQVLLPALRMLARLNDDGASVAVDSDGIPLDGRLAGWLNVSDVHAFNRLHQHGDDVLWSLVYFVASGEGGGESASEEAGAASMPSDSAGALLLKAKVDGANHVHGYLPVYPRAGELWCFPGQLQHAVMPRELCSAPPPPGGPARGMRISVACNVYLLTSPYRDAAIGYSPTTPVASPQNADGIPAGIGSALGALGSFLACGASARLDKHARDPPRDAADVCSPSQRPKSCLPQLNLDDQQQSKHCFLDVL